MNVELWVLYDSVWCVTAAVGTTLMASTDPLEMFKHFCFTGGLRRCSTAPVMIQKGPRLILLRVLCRVS